MRARKSGERAFRTLRYVSTEKLQQTRQLIIFTMATLLQRPPLAMFDPSLIHRNDEIFNPEPNRLGIFFRLNSAGYSIPQRARWEQIVRFIRAIAFEIKVHRKVAKRQRKRKGNKGTEISCCSLRNLFLSFAPLR